MNVLKRSIVANLMVKLRQFILPVSLAHSVKMFCPGCLEDLCSSKEATGVETYDGYFVYYHDKCKTESEWDLNHYPFPVMTFPKKKEMGFYRVEYHEPKSEAVGIGFWSREFPESFWIKPLVDDIVDILDRK